MKSSDLKKTLELVSLGLADTNLVPVFQCFCFRGGNALSYNDQIGIIASSSVNEEFAIHGKTFLGLLRNSSAENLEFKLNGNEVTIKADRSTFKLPFLPAEDFIFEEPEISKGASVTTINILEGLKCCLTTVSKDQAQPALMGVYLNSGRLYGCDGDAVTKVELGGDTGADSCILPNAFCHAVLRVSEETKCTTGLLTFDKDWACVDFENDYTIYGRLIQNDSPIDFDALIEKTIKDKLTFVPVPVGLDEALARSQVIADIETAPTVFTVEANRLKLLTDARAGTVRESLSMGGHPDVQVALSAEMVQRCINLCDEICLMKNCLVGRKGAKLLQVVSSMDS